MFILYLVIPQPYSAMWSDCWKWKSSLNVLALTVFGACGKLNLVSAWYAPGGLFSRISEWLLKCLMSANVFYITPSFFKRKGERVTQLHCYTFVISIVLVCAYTLYQRTAENKCPACLVFKQCALMSNCVHDIFTARWLTYTVRAFRQTTENICKILFDLAWEVKCSKWFPWLYFSKRAMYIPKKNNILQHIK